MSKPLMNDETDIYDNTSFESDTAVTAELPSESQTGESTY